MVSSPTSTASCLSQPRRVRIMVSSVTHSVCIWYRTWPARDCGRPGIFRTAATSPAHWLTPAPYEPVKFPGPPAPPPPPPPLPAAASASAACESGDSLGEKFRGRADHVMDGGRGNVLQ